MQSVVQDNLLDVWSDLRIGSADIHVKKEEIPKVSLLTAGIEHRVLIKNVQDLVNVEEQSQIENRKRLEGKDAFSRDEVFADYQDALELVSYLNQLLLSRMIIAFGGLLKYREDYH